MNKNRSIRVDWDRYKWNYTWKNKQTIKGNNETMFKNKATETDDKKQESEVEKKKETEKSKRVNQRMSLGRLTISRHLVGLKMYLKSKDTRISQRYLPFSHPGYKND